METKYDCIIIGGGVAALTAALYLGRYERSVLVVADSIGGQAGIAGSIENFPGFESIDGFELVARLKKQVEKNKSVTIREGESTKELKEIDGKFQVKTEREDYFASTILIATGKRHRQLGLKNEDALVGKGVSYCATCDGQFARGKTVGVAGGGNSAVEAAQIVSKVAKKVYLINLNEKFNAETARVKQIEQDEKIEILLQTKLTGLVSNGTSLAGIEIEKNDKSKSTINCQMIFVEIGWLPNTELFTKIVDLNEAREIKIDPADNQTSKKSIFAAGDVSDVLAKQIVVACGEGAKAAIAINKILG